MTWKDKLEIGLKEDAQLRRDNLPDFQKRPNTPDTEPGDPTRSPVEPGARETKEALHVDALPGEREGQEKEFSEHEKEERQKKAADHH